MCVDRRRKKGASVGCKSFDWERLVPGEESSVRDGGCGKRVPQRLLQGVLRGGADQSRSPAGTSCPWECLAEAGREAVWACERHSAVLLSSDGYSMTISFSTWLSSSPVHPARPAL